MTPTEKIEPLRQLLAHPGWGEILRPALEKRITAMERELIDTLDMTDVDTRSRRIMIKELRDWIKKPESMLKTFSKPDKSGSTSPLEPL